MDKEIFRMRELIKKKKQCLSGVGGVTAVPIIYRIIFLNVIGVELDALT